MLVDSDKDHVIDGFERITEEALIVDPLIIGRERSVNLVALTGGVVCGSVQFVINGTPGKTENYPPYALAGDNKSLFQDPRE
jgi:hypothetical protein